MKTKLTAFILLAAMLAMTVSCGAAEDNSATKDTTTDETTAGTETAAPVLPDADFGGYEFTFLNGNTSYTYRSVVAEEQNGETMNDAIYLRNTKVEDRYKIHINEVSSTSPQNDYTKSVQTGDNAFDVALLRMEWAFPVVLENGAVNWSNIPHLNLDRDYWVQGSVSGMSLCNNVYFAVSLFDTSHFESVRTFLFNKRMVDDYKLESPYDLVNSGKWTLSKFYEMAMSVGRDLDNNGSWTEDDLYGVIGYSNVLCNTLMTGVDAILSISKDENDEPYFDLDNEYNINRLLKVSAMFENKGGFVYAQNKQDIFRNGNALFLNCLFSEVVNLRDMEDDFGIIPTPKYDENQTDYMNLGGSPFFMTVPVTAPDLDRTGLIMESLAYYSMGLVDNAYYDIVLKGKSSRDEESVEMLDLIFSTLQYYHPLANSYLNSPLADNYIWNGKTDFASYFASVRDSIQNDIDEAMTTYRENVK